MKGELIGEESISITTDSEGKMRLVPFAIVVAVLATLNLVHAESQIRLSFEEQVEWAKYGLIGRIVNGTKAASRQFPYQVSLRRSYNSRHFCGGSVINKYYVVTAAHCMFLNGGRIQPWTVMVVAGELQLNQQTAAGQRKGVDAITIHPDFNGSTLQNDIAILTLKEPFKLTPEINVAPLSAETVAPNSICQVAGWGYPSDDFPVVSNDLMYVDLPIVNRDVCLKLLENITDLPPGMFCAGYMEGMKDACQGDSGGGMVCNGVLSGVVSGGEGCAVPGYPGVYSDVYFFRDWIVQNAKIEDDEITEGSSAEGPTVQGSTVEGSSAEKVSSRRK